MFCGFCCERSQRDDPSAKSYVPGGDMKTSILKRTPVVWAGALICCALWGSAFPCIKLGYKWMKIGGSDTMSQILYAGVRFTLAGIFAVILGSLIQRKALVPSKKALPKIFKLSLIQTVAQYLFFYIGLAKTSGVKSSIIDATNVFLSIIVASLLFKQEKITTRKIVGCIVGFAGVVLINMNGASIDAGISLTGEGFIFISAVAYAFSSAYLKKYSENENPVMLSGYQFICGGLIMTTVGYAAGGRFPVINEKSILMLVWLGTVSAIAYSLWGILLKYNDVSRVTVFGFMTPVFGVMLSAIFLKEAKSLGASGVIALTLVCAGIYIVNKGKKEQQENN